VSGSKCINSRGSRSEEEQLKARRCQRQQLPTNYCRTGSGVRDEPLVSEALSSPQPGPLYVVVCASPVEAAPRPKRKRKRQDWRLRNPVPVYRTCFSFALASSSRIQARATSTMADVPPVALDDRLANFVVGTSYQVLDVIGEGAYGTVWCARPGPLPRIARSRARVRLPVPRCTYHPSAKWPLRCASHRWSYLRPQLNQHAAANNAVRPLHVLPSHATRDPVTPSLQP
jgi:hypothetical protein